MQRQSTPKHRHDGTSPLPLGMDWSPPPRVWGGRETVWPHDPRTGWSYCVTIPSWIVLAKSKDSDPTVFYRVQVGLQSPEGITTTRTVLRRFNDFLKLHAAIKRSFPQKNVPPTPPKGLLRMKTKAMLEARRGSLEEWMTKLLSDIDLSRSMPVASFLELEAAARASFQDENQHGLDPNSSVSMVESSHHVDPNSSLSATAGSSSMASDYGSDTAYEASEVGTTSLGRDNNSEVGLDDLTLYDDVSSPVDKFVKYGMTNIDEGLSMGHAILEKLENFPKHKLHPRDIHSSSEHKVSNGSSSKASHHMEDTIEHRSEPEHGLVVPHVRKLSNESIGSDRSSQRGSELSNILFPNSNGHGILDFRSGMEISNIGTVEDSDFKLPDNIHLLVPMEQRQKLNRVLMTLQRRLITAKTDMEDLISRLNQEIAVKEYLTTKVKDLEVELETTKQKSKENLEQALLTERERVTQMQWDMEELKQRAMEMELKSSTQKAHTQSDNSAGNRQQDDVLHEELDSVKQQFVDLLKRYQDLELQSKSDMKVLVKEVKSLRSSQAELKQQLKEALSEKSEAQELLQEERERKEQSKSSLMNLLDKCKTIYDQLQDCSNDYLKSPGGDEQQRHSSSLLDCNDLVGIPDDQIDLFAKVQRLAEDDLNAGSTSDRAVDDTDDCIGSVDRELRKMLVRILVDNGVLRKQMNSLMLRGVKTGDPDSNSPDVSVT
ncbi:PX domain-containing protein EREL2-like isoform X2 [Andrographis paniculata]|uniref:PX domain-containing protein EREL2-like isoform X2 n=1 Tax=Andrographis paniculata TaxID=175694 RepID=UPI0021E95FF8|nr:PX domain-containing protein EREL2-like isoform X2 [Andrographis paniculata]